MHDHDSTKHPDYYFCCFIPIKVEGVQAPSEIYFSSLPLFNSINSELIIITKSTGVNTKSLLFPTHARAGLPGNPQGLPVLTPAPSFPPEVWLLEWNVTTILGVHFHNTRAFRNLLFWNQHFTSWKILLPSLVELRNFIMYFHDRKIKSRE